MSLITRMLKQTCVYWPPASEDTAGVANDEFGQPEFGVAVELACRWEDVTEQFISADRSMQASKSKVYVASDVSVGGVLCKGTLTTMTSLIDPKLNDGAGEILGFNSLPNIRVTEYLRIAYL